MIKKFNLILKKKNIYKNILYIFIFFISIFFSYFSIPKFFIYSPKLIEESFKRNNDIDIKNISKITYNVFPTPRLRVFGGNLNFKENTLEANGSEIEIILNPNNILNSQKLDYNKIIIKEGSVKINTENTDQIFNFFKKKKQKIFLKKNNLILKKNLKILFEINNSTIKINPEKNRKLLSINGIFLNHKITFLLDNNFINGNNIKIKIPELDISTNIFFENKNSSNFFNGFVNFKVLNNFFKFNFIKEKKLKISKGFIRSNLLNTAFEGEVTLKPSFFVNLIFEPTILNMEKLFFIIQKKYFSDDVNKLEQKNKLKLIKKINGFFTFKNIIYGDVTFQNAEILFKNFKIGVNNPLLFDARISEFGKKGKIYFNILKTIQLRKGPLRELKISGYILPSNSKIIFKKLLFDKEYYAEERIKNYEKKFNNEVIQKSLSNIFDDSKMNNFFNSFKN